jgi:hypothetical protein
MLLLDKNMTLEMSMRRPSFGERGEISPNLPSWKESAEFLSADQRKAADIVFTRKVLAGAFIDARKKLPELRAKDEADPTTYSRRTKKDDQDLVYRHITGLLDASDAVQKGPIAEAAFKEGNSTWGDEGKDLLLSVKPLVTQKGQVYVDARNWKEADIITKVNEAHAYLTHLPKSMKTYMYAQVGLTPETVREKVKRWTPTGVATIASIGASEGLPALGAAVATAVEPLKDVQNPYVLGGVTLASYVPWVWNNFRAGVENVRQLDESGNASNIFAKRAYDKHPHDRVKRVIDTVFSTAKPDLASEAWYWAFATLSSVLTENVSTGAGIILVANTVAAMKEDLQVEISQHISRSREDGTDWKRTLVKGIARNKFQKYRRRYEKAKSYVTETKKEPKLHY